MSKTEEILLHISVMVVALFANKFVTYEFSVPKYAITTSFSLLICAMLVYRVFKEKELKLYVSMANISWFLFSIASLLSTVTVYRENRFYFRYSIDIAIYILLTAFIGLYISNRFRTKESITRLLLTFVGTGVVVAIDALLNFYTGKSIFLGTIGEPYSRAAIKSTIGNTIFVANYVTMLLIPSLYFILSLDFGWQKYSYKNTVMVKIFSLVAAFLFVTTVVVSQTRSEYISIVFSVLILVILYFVYAKRTQSITENKDVENDLPRLKKMNKILLMTLLIGVALILFVYNTDNPLTVGGQISVTSRFSAMATISSRDERFLAWLGSIYQWKDSKLIGTGIGTYQVMAIDKLQNAMKDHPNLLYGWNNFKRTHNDYLQVLGETGILGLGAILLLMCVLIVYAFKYMKFVQDKDDLLLFLVMACAFIAFMVQSFFSFPGHILPNSLLALFLAATATGAYFNRRKILAREIHLKGSSLWLFIIPLLITVLSSTYFKWNYFISEVYFKNGNNYYNGLISISNDKNVFQQYEKIYLQKIKELNDLEGDFINLRPENYKQPNLSGIELEKQRINQIANIRAELQKNLAAVQNNLKKADELERTYTRKAKESLIKALKLNHAYGKAHFYLASLCLRSTRILEVANALSKKDYSVLKQEYDDYQKCIADQYRSPDLLFTVSLMENRPELIKDIATMQSIIDSCGLFKTSLLSFNERNTYKALVARYQALCDAVNQLINELKREPNDPVSMKAFDELKKLREKYIQEFTKYSKATVDRLPGGWNRFPDWKNVDLSKAISGEDIYRMIATLAVSLDSLTSSWMLDLLEYLAQVEVWACEGMAAKGVWGVPDGVAEYLWVIAAELEKTESDKAKNLYKKMIQMYQPAYERINKQIKSIDIDSEIENYLSGISLALSRALAENGVTPEKIQATNGSIKGFAPQIQNYLKNIDWEAIVRAELNSLVYDKKWNHKFTITKNLSETLLSGIRNLVNSLLKDQNKASQVLNKILPTVANLPYQLLLWEREIRFLEFYKMLSAKQRDFALKK